MNLKDLLLKSNVNEVSDLLCKANSYQSYQHDDFGDESGPEVDSDGRENPGMSIIDPRRYYPSEERLTRDPGYLENRSESRKIIDTILARAVSKLPGGNILNAPDGLSAGDLKRVIELIENGFDPNMLRNPGNLAATWNIGTSENDLI